MKTKPQMMWALVSFGILIQGTYGDNATTVGSTGASTVNSVAAPSDAPTSPTASGSTGTLTIGPSGGPGAGPSDAPSTSITGTAGMETTSAPNFSLTVASGMRSTSAAGVGPSGAPSTGSAGATGVVPTGVTLGATSVGPTGSRSVGPIGTLPVGPTDVTSVIPSGTPSVGPTNSPSVAPAGTPSVGPTGSPATGPSRVATNAVTMVQTTLQPSRTEPKTQSMATASDAAATPTLLVTDTVTGAQPPNVFHFFMSQGNKDHEKKSLIKLCEWMMGDMLDATCNLTVREHGNKTEFDNIILTGKGNPTLARRYYEDIEKSVKKSGDNTTLIAILASCGALLAMIVGLAVYASRQRKPYCENQQHLTEELQTVENGYHDNPTLEVMEVQPEMQEKKMAPNGEFNDSWIVPIDNLLKGDATPDEEDTHL